MRRRAQAPREEVAMTRMLGATGTSVVLFLGGCCMTPTPVASPTPGPVVAVPPGVEPAPAPAAAGPTGDVCARAEECCRAYVAAMGPAGAAAASSCDAMHTTIGMAAAAPGCQSAIEGWRAGLTAMSQPVPPSCQ
jgi:hypothetical protein